MWLFFGLGAIVFACLNLYNFYKNRDSCLYRFISMALTCLTLLDFYRDGAQRVINEGWAGLMDILPTMATALLFLTLASIIINGITLFKRKKKSLSKYF